jgi:hypothetical protein
MGGGSGGGSGGSGGGGSSGGSGSSSGGGGGGGGDRSGQLSVDGLDGLGPGAPRFLTPAGLSISLSKAVVQIKGDAKDGVFEVAEQVVTRKAFWGTKVGKRSVQLRAAAPEKGGQGGSSQGQARGQAQVVDSAVATVDLWVTALAENCVLQYSPVGMQLFKD